LRLVVGETSGDLILPIARDRVEGGARRVVSPPQRKSALQRRFRRVGSLVLRVEGLDVRPATLSHRLGLPLSPVRV